MARMRGASCPKGPPDPYRPGVSWDGIGGAHFSVDLTIVDALQVVRKPRVCGYLTAPLRVLGSVRTRTVAHTQARIAAAASDTGSSRTSDAEKTAGRIVAWILVALIVAGIVAGIWRAERSANERSEGKHRQDPDDDESAVPEAASKDLPPGYEFVQRRRGEEVTFAIQRAVGTTADVYRDRLRRILEHQDGPDWLDAFNARRRADMLGRGQRRPASYASLEPRAVLNCLAYDPAGLQLIGLDAVAAARQLCGLAKRSASPRPRQAAHRRRLPTRLAAVLADHRVRGAVRRLSHRLTRRACD